MKSKIAVLFLIVLLCLTSGCNNTSHIAEQPVPVSSSGSNEAPDQSETAQATEKTEVEQPRSTEPKDDDRSTEATAGVLDSSIQTKPASEQPNSGTTPPQVSEPSKTRVRAPSGSLCTVRKGTAHTSGNGRTKTGRETTTDRTFAGRTNRASI